MSEARSRAERARAKMAEHAQRGAPWRARLQRDRDGEVMPVLHNLLTILENTYTGFEKPMSDNDLTRLRCDLATEWRATWSRRDVIDAVACLRQKPRG